MKIPILIVEDEAFIALSLSLAAEDTGAVVIGPVSTVAEALDLLDQSTIYAAVLDANLQDRDVTPLALRLIEKAVPFVIHTGTGLPAELAAIHPPIAVIMKPTPAPVVLAALMNTIQTKAQVGTGNNWEVQGTAKRENDAP